MKSTKPNSHDTRACISNKLEHDSYHIHTLELFFLFCAGLNVIIKQNAGAPTAGQSFNLTCTVRLKNITGPPTIGWLVPSNPIFNSSSITLENNVTVNDTAYERALVFSSLHTSHGGQYTCQTTLSQISTMASTNISVQSAYVKSMSFYVHSS